MPALISTKTHAAMDYVLGPTLLAVPNLLGLESSSPSAVAPRAVGLSAIVVNVFTDHELGLAQAIPMRTHLMLDAGSGVALAAVPWLTGEARKGARYWLPHLVVGVKEVAFAFLTERQPSRSGG